VNIVLESSSTNYAYWPDLMEQALQRYALLEHVTDDASSTDPGWIQMDIVVLNWISNSISADLHHVVHEHGCTTRHLWLAIKNQFLGNREHRILHLDAAFRTFVQGDLSINEYYRKFKVITDGLADLTAPVDNRILVLNILWGLNQRFKHVGSIIRRYSPFPNSLKDRDDLLLEKLHMDSTGPPAAPMALYTNITSPVAKPPPSTPSRSLHGSNSGTGPSITTKTIIVVMATATTERTAPTAGAVVALLARPPPPLVSMAGPTLCGRPTTTHGSGT
jgi:hypothetical protein